MAAKDLTLRACLEVANTHWAGRRGHRSMIGGASRCVKLLGEDLKVSNLSPLTGVRLMAKLRDRGINAKSVAVYYGQFRRMLALNDVSTAAWPNAPVPSRKAREALSVDDAEALEEQLRKSEAYATADLARLIRATGLRVDVEALDRKALRFMAGEAYDTLEVTGKGGHQRVIPVVDPKARAILRDPDRMEVIRSTQYWTHLRKWNGAIAKLGIVSKRPTPHAMRHHYATHALKLTGGNLVMVQELLGHQDPKTTALYLKLDLGDKAAALLSGST